MEIDDMWNDEEDRGHYTLHLSENEIKPVSTISKDGDAYVVKCPHCGAILGVEGEDSSEVRGSQYQHKFCGGWFQVNYNAQFVKELR